MTDARVVTLERRWYGDDMTTAAEHDRHHRTTPQSVAHHLDRAAALLWEVDVYFRDGIDTREENAANLIALTQLLVAAANANLRMAETEMAAHGWREQL